MVCRREQLDSADMSGRLAPFSHVESRDGVRFIIGYDNMTRPERQRTRGRQESERKQLHEADDRLDLVGMRHPLRLAVSIVQAKRREVEMCFRKMDLAFTYGKHGGT